MLIRSTIPHSTAAEAHTGDVRQPRWIRGAYAKSPSVHQLDGDGRWCGSAAIESWCGTPEELVHAAQALVGLLGAGSAIKVTLSLADGRVLAPTNLEELQRQLSDAPDQVLAARVEAAGGDECGVLIARQHLPGLVVHIED